MQQNNAGGCGSSGPMKEQINAQTIQKAAVDRSLGKIKNKFLVMSGKGGVGKSSTSVNLAIALSRKGYQVGIMDVDMHGPDVPRMLGLSGDVLITEEHKLIPVNYSDHLKVISIESILPNKDDAIIWRGAIKYNAIQQFIGDVAWGDLDFLIIDSPPGTGDEPLTIAQTITDARAIIVTTPQEVSLADVRKSINFCKRVNLEIFGLIENMSGFTCPHCGVELELFGSGGGQRTAEQTKIPFLGKIPFDPGMVSCGDSGTSYQEKFEGSETSKVFAVIAEKMAELI
ncbi:MAG: Mrp/NBP35 family ATP-binding protein [Desulfobacterales bacterium]|nr:Mrp/NBP35 family ATP-binding protein [Desulfobacterales bacterium]MDD4071351.1 Mrp/NBP35 family ATP-binding protein [Desulfobacterales bacterium]MDD4392677.1 Mrp/NBP35 family ATP-binding protein [Desulfobacterales bacterium]